MSNLGPYQDIVVRAHAAGGVELLIKQIQDAAAANALQRVAPGFLAAGALSAAALIFGGRKARDWVRDYRARQAQIIADGEAAAAKLAEMLEPEEEDGIDDESPQTDR